MGDKAEGMKGCEDLCEGLGGPAFESGSESVGAGRADGKLTTDDFNLFGKVRWPCRFLGDNAGGFAVAEIKGARATGNIPVGGLVVGADPANLTLSFFGSALHIECD